jgi:TonB family protein
VFGRPVLVAAQPGETPNAEGERSESEMVRVVRPEPLETAVSYPPGAQGDATVVLQFVVAVDGSVRDVEVLVGDEPFASEATKAAANWRFTPASYGDRIVPAKIRFEVQFTAVEAEPPPTSPGTQEAPLSPGAGEPPKDQSTGQPTPGQPIQPTAGRAEARVEETVEVSVEGERVAGSTRLTRAEARQIPGALGDPLRAVETLPGVTPTVSGLPLYYVRGAPPGNVGYFIDEIRIPLLYHAFLGPSVVHPELIERVNLYPGPYPASFGRFAGAIVSADLRTPKQEFDYRAELGIFDSGGYVETPFADGRGSVFLGGRYSYLGLLVSALTPNTLEFWNYQALIEYDLSPRDTVRVFALGAFDYLEDQTDNFFGTEFHRVDLRYTRTFSADTMAQAGLTLGIDDTDWAEGKVSDEMIAGRFRLEHRPLDTLLWRTGLSFNRDAFDLELDSRSSNFEDLRFLFRARGDSSYGGFTDLVWRPSRWVTFTPGIRVDLYESAGQSEVGVDPRVTARLRINDDIETVHGVGISHQTPNYVPNVPGARVAGLSGGLQRAVHTSSGVEAKLTNDWSGVVSVFNNAIFDVTDPYSATQDFTINADEVNKRPLGHSYGIELSARRPLTRRFGAFASYTLSRTTRTYKDYETVSGSDRTHVLNLAGLYTLGPNWRFGGRTVFTSGVPGRLRGRQRIFDQGRSAPFFRADLRLERRFRLSDVGYVSVVAELLNATFSSEVIRRGCDIIDGERVCEDVVVGPITLPNLKVEARF